MTEVNGTELAKELGVTKGAVSQWVAAGRLDGCFTGDGRARRFNLEKVAAAIGKTGTSGQRLGNGSKTVKAARKIATAAPENDREENAGMTPEGNSTKEPDRYEFARIVKAEEEARRIRRQNAEAEGLFVLASQVKTVVEARLGQEIAEFESVLRKAARKIADKMGIDYKEARLILVNEWRNHRARRTQEIIEDASNINFNDAETAMDF